jgi:hypothetical protein
MNFKFNIKVRENILSTFNLALITITIIALYFSSQRDSASIRKCLLPCKILLLIRNNAYKQKQAK